MLKRDVQIGDYFAIRHGDDPAHRLSVVQVVSENRFGGWDCLKLKTMRFIRIKSAQKFRSRVEKVDGKWAKAS